MKKELIIGETVDVLLAQRRYICRVEAVSGEGGLEMTAPRYRGEPIPMLGGELMQVTYYRPNGMYTFLAVYEHSLSGGERVAATIRSPITQRQRRDFVRLSVRAPVMVRAVPREEDTEPEDATAADAILRMLLDRAPHPAPRTREGMMCHTLDISGGGLCLLAPRALPENSLLACVLSLPGGSVAADARVVRSVPDEEQPDYYRVSARFTGIEERARRKILKYIFEARQANEDEEARQANEDDGEQR